MFDSWLLAPWALIVLLPLTFLVVVAAALLGRSSPIRLRHWAEGAGGPLAKLYDAPARFEALRLLLELGAKLLPVVLGWTLWITLSGWSWLQAQGAHWPLAAAVGTVVLLLLVMEWLNHLLVERYTEVALERLTGGVRVLLIVLGPLIFLLAPVVPHATDEVEPEEDEDEDDPTDNELEAFIDVGRREGILEPGEGELVRSIVDFGDTQVKRVMIPRVEIQSAP
ncbi:MAG: CNNM domain-containing protein, partial [Acidobacteriota bacterium]